MSKPSPERKSEQKSLYRIIYDSSSSLSLTFELTRMTVMNGEFFSTISSISHLRVLNETSYRNLDCLSILSMLSLGRRPESFSRSEEGLSVVVQSTGKGF